MSVVHRNFTSSSCSRLASAFRNQHFNMRSQLQRCSPRQNATTLLLAIICVSQLLSGALAQTEPPKTAADYYVKSLPGAPDGPLLKMHAGHVQVEDEHNGHLFFWHFENRHISDRQRTVIWLNGGPGCSSEDGAMMEIGPYRVAEEGNLVYNNGSWDEFANLLFVDNPIGTGYSYVDGNGYIHELQTMADQFIVFLEKWFAVFPQYEFDDLYISGESYAGQHIPYIAKAILDRNARSGVRPWNLMGLLIGNGWISPIDQYPSYLKMAYDSGLVVKDSHEAQILETKQAVCLSKLKEPDGEHVDVVLCEAILTDLLRMTSDRTKPDDQQCVNMYDIRLRDSYPSCGMNWPPDLPAVTTYLRRSDVVSALNLDPAKKAGWTECNGAVGGAFNAAKSTPAVHLLPDILETVPVLLFSGDQDMICNHFGTEALIHSLEWNGGEGFEISPGVWAPRRDWSFEGEPAGTYQAARNLTYVLFYNSSHMVPFDYPRRTRDMLDRFMGVDIASIGGSPQESLIDGEKGLETSVGGHPNSTVATEEEQAALQEAKWNAYYRSGEVVLVIVIIAAGFWFYYIWKDRRQRAGYQGVENNTNNILMGMRNAFSSSASLETAKANGHERRDLEAADFDEAELDHIGNNTEPLERRYDVDSISDHEDEKPYRA